MRSPSPRRTLAVSATGVTLVLLFLFAPTVAQATVDDIHPLRPTDGAPLVAAHRGGTPNAPENTLSALAAALERGPDLVETDVRLSLDGVPVLMHDPTVDRTTDGAGRVADLTLAELRELDAGAWFGEAFAGERVPTLDEFLDLLVDADNTAVLELKGSWNRADVGIVRDAVVARGLDERVVLASFDLWTIASSRGAAPELPVVVIFRELPDDVAAVAAAYGVLGVLTRPSEVAAAPEVVGELHAIGVSLLLYTLNTPTAWAEAVALDVDGIVTDEPARLDAWLAPPE